MTINNINRKCIPAGVVVIQVAREGEQAGMD